MMPYPEGWCRAARIGAFAFVACLCGCWPWVSRPSTDDPAYREGVRLFLAGSHTAAATKLKSFLAKGPGETDAADAHYFLGAIALRQGAAQSAAGHFNTALRAPRNDQVRAGAELGLARSHFLRGDYRQCRAACLDLLRDDRAAPRADEILFLLAEACGRAGISAEARRHYQQVAARFPSSPLAAKARARLAGRGTGMPPPAPSPRPTPIGGRYTVQVAALASAATANQMVARLKRQGFAAQITTITVGARKLHAVRVGPYGAKAAATQAAARLRRAGYKVIIKP